MSSMTERAMLAAIALLATSLALGAISENGLSTADEAAVRAVTLRYRDAWLANDPEQVMATLTHDAVLMPSGMPAIAGEAAIRRFWFPSGGPRTEVTGLELAIDEVRGSGTLAVVRGTGRLTYVMTYPDGRVRQAAQRSWFVNVAERQDDGRWLIARRMWSDLPAPGARP